MCLQRFKPSKSWNNRELYTFNLMSTTKATIYIKVWHVVKLYFAQCIISDLAQSVLLWD